MFCFLLDALLRRAVLLCTLRCFAARNGRVRDRDDCLQIGLFESRRAFEQQKNSS